MADYNDIKQSIATNLPDNNNREITAAKLRSTLNEFVDKVEATETGLEQKCEVLNNIDDEPTVGSNNLVKSNGVASMLIKLTGMGVDSVSAGATSIGDIFYNTSSKLLRRVIALSPKNEETVSFFKGAIYTIGNDFYVYDPTQQVMIIAPSIINDKIIELRTSIFKKGSYLKKDGTTVEDSNYYITPYIPVSPGDTIKVGGYSGGTSYNYSLLCFYKSDKTWLSSHGNDGNPGFTELEIVVPTDAAYMRVGSRDNVAGVNVINKSYIYCNEFYKIFDNIDSLSDSVKSAINQVTSIQESVNSVVPYTNLVKELGWQLKLKGNANSYVSCNSPIVLSQNGDSIEIEFDQIITSGISTGGYAFTSKGAGTTGIFVWNAGVSIRSDDNTWIISSTGIGFGSNKTLKVEFADGNINTYVDGELKNTYSGLKTITIKRIGNGSGGSYGYWNGIIKSIKVNTVVKDFSTDFTFGSDAGLYRASGFLSDEQQAQIDSFATNPKFVIEASASQVKVFQNMYGNVYIGLNINHFLNSADDVYRDYWEIAHSSQWSEVGQFYTYSNGAFIGMGIYPLNIAENEFAIQFYNNDFTGGVHGNERIDLNNSCYIVFIVDGKEYSIEELIALGSISCNSFSYREKSILYSLYSVTQTHDEIAEHVKITEFKDGGYVTRNHIKMLAALTVKNAYSGLVCVNKNCAGYVVDNEGTVFTMSHPATSVIVPGYKNDTNFLTKMYNGDLSCVLNSRVVGGNVSVYNNASPNVIIWDRLSDTKYYATMPQDVPLQINDVFEFECIARWNYKSSN